MSANIVFIGLGNMGLPMAQNLVKAGFSVSGHDLVKASVDKLVEVGGKTEAEFVDLMDKLQLPRPKRIDEAVPANLTSGLRHDVEGALLLQPRPPAGPHAGRPHGRLGPPSAAHGPARRPRVRPRRGRCRQRRAAPGGVEPAAVGFAGGR